MRVPAVDQTSADGNAVSIDVGAQFTDADGADIDFTISGLPAGLTYDPEGALFTTHFTNFHTAANVRVGQDYAPGASHLLQYLISQAQIPEYQVRFRWRANSMAMWDNRSTQHYAVMDYPPCHRKMERAGIIGDAPF